MEYKRKDRVLSIVYSALFALSFPVNLIYLDYVGKVALLGGFGFHGSWKILVPLIFWSCMTGLGIANLICAVRLNAGGEWRSCVQGMMIHKIGLLVFWCMKFYTIYLLAGILYRTMRGAIYFSFPALPPVVWILGILEILSTLLAVIPGAFYGIQVICGLRREGYIKRGSAIIHTVFQFIPAVDMLDVVYLHSLLK